MRLKRMRQREKGKINTDGLKRKKDIYNVCNCVCMCMCVCEERFRLRDTRVG